MAKCTYVFFDGSCDKQATCDIDGYCARHCLQHMQVRMEPDTKLSKWRVDKAVEFAMNKEAP